MMFHIEKVKQTLGKKKEKKNKGEKRLLTQSFDARD